MNTVIQYRVKPEHAAENRQLIEDVFAELEERKPAGIRYASYLHTGGVSFVHTVTTEAGVADVLPRLPAFKRFQEHLGDRCEEQPTRQRFEQVGGCASEPVPVTAGSVGK